MEKGTALLEGRGTGRRDSRIWFVLFACCLGTCLLAGAATPALAKHHGSPRLALSFMSESQNDQALLSSGTVAVGVRSPRARKLVLAVRGFGGGPVLTDPRRVSTDAGKMKTISLALSATGREVLQGCGSDSLLLTAKAPGKSKKRKKGKSPKGHATLTHSVPQCDSLSRAARCEIIASPDTNCLFPFPSDHYTVADPSTPTGLRVNLERGLYSGESQRRPHQPGGHQPQRRLQSRGEHRHQGPRARQPDGLPEDRSRPAHRHGPGLRRRDQPIVLIDASTGQRQLILSELDSTASSPGNTDLIIRPGRNLIEGHRYIVAMRNLKDADGNVIPAPPGFALYRDGVKTDVPAIESRRGHFDEIFSKLQQAGIGRGDLYDAWDFTVASTTNITQRMLSIRDRGLADLGDTTPGDGVMQGSAPSFTVTDVKTVDDPTNPLTGSHATENVREVTGTYQVPCSLNSPGCAPGGQFDLGSGGLPQQTPGNFQTARFTCNIPKSAVTETSPGSGVWNLDHTVRPSMYGHGLFGDYTEVHTTNVRQLGNDEGVLTCATDFTGMMEDDVGTAIQALQDLSKFQPIPDGLQQGFLNFIYLGRLLMLSKGFSNDPAFQFGGQSVIDHGERPLLLRQQPGRDRRGRADGGRARHHPHGPLRAGHELLDPPHPQRGLRGLRPGPLSVLSERVGAAAAARDGPDDVGPRRAGRLRQPHDH